MVLTRGFFVEGSNLKWSPGSKKIAYVKEDENDTSQIYVKNLINESESKITNFGHNVKDFSWSPNGEFFSFSAFQEYEDNWIIDIPGKVDGEEYE